MRTTVTTCEPHAGTEHYIRFIFLGMMGRCCLPGRKGMLKFLVWKFISENIYLPPRLVIEFLKCTHAWLPS